MKLHFCKVFTYVEGKISSFGTSASYCHEYEGPEKILDTRFTTFTEADGCSFDSAFKNKVNFFIDSGFFFSINLLVIFVYL